MTVNPDFDFALWALLRCLCHLKGNIASKPIPTEIRY